MATLDNDLRAAVLASIGGNAGPAARFVLDNGDVLGLFRQLLDPEGSPGFNGDAVLSGGPEQVAFLVRLAQENGVHVTLQLDSPVRTNSRARVVFDATDTR